MSKQRGYTAVELIFVILWFVGIWGWIWNIVKIVHSDFGHIGGMLVIRCIGVFVAPLGAVLGFL